MSSAIRASRSSMAACAHGRRRDAPLRRARIALVDVRPDEEFTGSDGGMAGAHAAGHIDGARQLPWGSLVGSDGRFLPVDQLRAKLAAAGAGPGKPVVAY